MKNERDAISQLLAELNTQPILPFPQEGTPLQAPTGQGVYVIRSSRNRVVHVGRTVRGKAGLRQRLRNHLAAQSSFVNVWLEGRASELRTGYTYQYLEVSDNRQRALLEHIATAWHCPAHLGTSG